MRGSKEDYLTSKKCPKHAVYNAKNVAQETRFTEINSGKDYNKIFKLAKQMKVENTDVTGDKCVKDKDNNLVLGNKEKLRVWNAHYGQLLNVKFDWDDSSLHIEPSVEDLAIKITNDMVPEAALKMKEGM